MSSEAYKNYTRAQTHLLRRRGVIQRKPCERCGAPDVEIHHEDYGDPLAIMWLCSKCHGRRHSELYAAGIEIPVPDGEPPRPPGGRRGPRKRLRDPVGVSVQFERRMMEDLAEIAASERRPISELVRESLDHLLIKREEQEARRKRRKR